MYVIDTWSAAKDRGVQIMRDFSSLKMAVAGTG